MTTYKTEITATVSNAGIRKEWAVCAHYNIKKVKHDTINYMKDSDVNVGTKHISVKSSSFSLMSGRLCNGYEDFDDIWNLYKTTTHSNTFAYVTEIGDVYEMDIDEFEKFVYAFCTLTRDSKANGGHTKIRCKHESKKMLRWFEERI